MSIVTTNNTVPDSFSVTRDPTRAQAINSNEKRAGGQSPRQSRGDWQCDLRRYLLRRAIISPLIAMIAISPDVGSGTSVNVARPTGAVPPNKLAWSTILIIA